MEANPWYFGKMSRQDAVLTLRQNNYPKGAFLVRDNTTNPDNYSISVVSKPGDDHKRKASIKHYKIQKELKKTKTKSKGWSICGGSKYIEETKFFVGNARYDSVES